MVDLIFVGRIDSIENKKKYRVSWTKPQLNSIKFQIQFLRQLQQLSKSRFDISVINLGVYGLFLKSNPIFGFFPRSSKIGNVNIQSFGYVNIPIIRFLQRLIGLLFKIIKTKKEKKLIFYSLDYTTLGLNVIIKALFRVQTSLYIVDAPVWLYNINQKNVGNRLRIKLLNNFNHFLLINENIKYKLFNGKGNFSILEGNFNPPLFTQHHEAKLSGQRKYNLVYAGSLLMGFGIHEFLLDFNLYNNGAYELHFAGPLDEYNNIDENLLSSGDVHYHGYLFQKELLELYQTADFFVIPRMYGREINLYSFPSKVFDYLSFGRPVVCYELECFDSKWNQVLIYADESIMKRINGLIIEHNYLDLYNIFLENRINFIDKYNNHKELNSFIDSFILSNSD